MNNEPLRVWILDRDETVLDWTWEKSEEVRYRSKDRKPFTKAMNRLTMCTAEDAFTVWDEDGKQYEVPQRIIEAPPSILPEDGRPVLVTWGSVELKPKEHENMVCLGYLKKRKLTPAERARLKPEEALTMTEALLFKIAVGCADMDAKINPKRRKPPSHWDVFKAAWMGGMNDYDMEASYKWRRRTAGTRLRAVECAYLGGAKVSDLQRDPAIMRNVEAELKAAHDCHARKLHRPDLLDNTAGTEDEDA